MPIFTEPNVAFSLQERIADRVRVRVHFSLEALPPWLRGAEQPDIFDFLVLLDMSAAEVAEAASNWNASLNRYPHR
ncbi:MAG TPA: hypothetical protein VF940_24825 [Streptosporangiaceae bacterium]